MLDLVRKTPWNSTQEVQQVFTDIGDGTTSIFDISGINTTTFLADDVQVAATTFYRNNAGVIIIDSTHFQLMSGGVPAAPSVGAVVIAPGSTAQTFNVYDTNVVTGVTNPNIDEQPFYLIDLETIQTTYWTATAAFPSGIRMQWTNLDPLNGPAASIIALAPSHPDGTPGTYLSAGAPIYFSNIEGTSTTTGAHSAGDTSIAVVDGTQFVQGSVIFINDGVNQEYVWLSTIATNTLTVNPLVNSYLSGANVFDAGRKGWGTCTWPPDNSGPKTFWNLSPRVTVAGFAR